MQRPSIHELASASFRTILWLKPPQTKKRVYLIVLFQISKRHVTKNLLKTSRRNFSLRAMDKTILRLLTKSACCVLKIKLESKMK